MNKMSVQVTVVTNGKGCRLRSRIRWEIVAQFPRKVGIVVEGVGKLMLLAKRR